MPQPINPTEEMEHMAALSRSHDPTFHFLNPLDITVRKELYSFLLISAIKQNNFEFNGRFAFSRFFFGALCICIVYIYVFASLFEFLICYAHVLWVFSFFYFIFEWLLCFSADRHRAIKKLMIFFLSSLELCTH